MLVKLLNNVTLRQKRLARQREEAVIARLSADEQFHRALLKKEEATTRFVASDFTAAVRVRLSQCRGTARSATTARTDPVSGVARIVAHGTCVTATAGWHSRSAWRGLARGLARRSFL